MSTFNWDAPSQNKVSDIRQEAKRRNISIPSGMKKNEMLALLISARENESNPQTTVNLKRSSARHSAQNSPVQKASVIEPVSNNQATTTFISSSLLDDEDRNQSQSPVVKSSPKKYTPSPQVQSKLDSSSYSTRSPTPINYGKQFNYYETFSKVLPYLVIIFLVLALCEEDFAPIAVILLIIYLITLIYKRNPRIQ